MEIRSEMRRTQAPTAPFFIYAAGQGQVPAMADYIADTLRSGGVPGGGGTVTS